MHKGHADTVGLSRKMSSGNWAQWWGNCKPKVVKEALSRVNLQSLWMGNAQLTQIQWKGGSGNKGLAEGRSVPPSYMYIQHYLCKLSVPYSKWKCNGKESRNCIFLSTIHSDQEAARHSFHISCFSHKHLPTRTHIFVGFIWHNSEPPIRYSAHMTGCPPIGRNACLLSDLPQNSPLHGLLPFAYFVFRLCFRFTIV